MIRATTFSGKRVAVFGLGQSGLATVRSLLAGGAQVAAWDDSDAGRDQAAAAGIPLSDLATADWAGFSSLILAPGVPLTHPEPHWTVRRAAAAGVEIIGDIEVFARERNAHAPDAPFIAITGTNGKSTTTALVAHILRETGFDVQMGGNIGRAVLTLEPAAADRFHVIEMSSFQIDLTPTLNPTVGVLLNITADHIDRHGSLEHYAAVKERLVQGATIAVIGVDDQWSLAALQRKAAHGATAAISAARQLAPGYCLADQTIVASNRDALAVRLAEISDISTLQGQHNAQNAIAAVAAVREALTITGRGAASVNWQSALHTFPGLPHRMEEVGRVGDVLFINDSKATNADSTEKALLSFPNDVFWIAGGKAKDGGIEALRPLFTGVRKAYLIGEASDQFAAVLDGAVAFERCSTLDRAVARAAQDAASSGAPAPVVLLSPACASYDQFRNFEVRGEAFRTLVAALPGVAMRGQE
jgi:UDP-N-acetylmuramoylalanine--D-glutamate ligase